jgi:hypothetical protein
MTSEEDYSMKKQFKIFGGASALILAAAATVAFAAPGDRGDARGMKMDSDGNGVLSKAEAVAGGDERFKKLDADGNGVIEAGDRAARAKQRFIEMDTDKNGSVSEAEFETAYQAKTAEHEARRSARAEGGEGRMGRKHKRGGHHGDVGKWGMADTNGDKAISRAEFDAATLARFTKADTNGDGNITKEERQAARQLMREQRKAARGNS